MRYIYADVSTAPLNGAVDYLPEQEAPANYKDPEKIAAYIADAKQKALDRAALDPDLCCITGLCFSIGDTPAAPMLCPDEATELETIKEFASLISQKHDAPPATLVGFNALRFDWPVLMRRARYLGVKLNINLDRYRSGHIDLSEVISNRGQLPVKSLGFYVKRLGWTDLQKPLDGAEEARVMQTGKWDELSASLCHDVEATRRLHQWWGQA